MANIPEINFNKIPNKNAKFNQAEFYEENFEKINDELVPKINELDTKVSVDILAQLADIASGDGINTDAITPDKINKSDYLVPTLVDLINRETVTNGKYMNPSGVEVTLANWSHSDFIPVVEGEKYYMQLKDSTGGSLVFQLEATYYDALKNPVGRLESKVMPYEWTVPADVAFIIVNFGTSYINDVYFKGTQMLPQKFNVNWINVKLNNLDNEVINKDNRWAGKKANFLGDSITTGAFLANPTTERYTALVKNALGLAVENNYGQSGTRLANNITASGASDAAAMCMRYTSMSNDADLIFVFGGTNDYGSGTPNGLKTAPFGTFSDRTNATFYGALHVLYSGLISKYIGKTIVIITPTHRHAIAGVAGNDYIPNPDTGKNLRDYVNAIREVAEYYGLYVLDLFKNLNINPEIPAIKTAYIPDSLHPNADGHKLISDAIVNFVKHI